MLHKIELKIYLAINTVTSLMFLFHNLIHLLLLRALLERLRIQVDALLAEICHQLTGLCLENGLWRLDDERLAAHLRSKHCRELILGHLKLKGELMLNVFRIKRERTNLTGIWEISPFADTTCCMS